MHLSGNYGSPTSEYRQVWNFCEAVLPIHGSVKFNASNIHESWVRKSLFGGLRLTFVNMHYPSTMPVRFFSSRWNPYHEFAILIIIVSEKSHTENANAKRGEHMHELGSITIQ